MPLRILLVGGNWNNGDNAGFWYFNANQATSQSNSNVGVLYIIFLLAWVFPYLLVKIYLYRTIPSKKLNGIGGK